MSDSSFDDSDGTGTSPSVQQCLIKIGIDAGQHLSQCTSLAEEFREIKKAYFKKILVVHPDKGGNAAEFREVNSSWELIRKLYEERAVASFVTAATSTQNNFDRDYGGSSSSAATSSASSRMPWQYYYDAATEEVPTYKVELARSGRSKCRGTMSARQCTQEQPFIAKGEIRIGSIDEMSGSYGRWIHLECWRVPNRIWQGLPADDEHRSISACSTALSGMNEVLFTGFNDLSVHHQHQIASHVADKRNWASRRGRRTGPSDLVTSSTRGGVGEGSTGSRPQTTGASHSTDGRSNSSFGAAGPQAGVYSGGDSSVSGLSAARPSWNGGEMAHTSMTIPSSGAELSTARHAESALVVAPTAGHQGRYVVPRPGVNGARADALKGKTIVMTGVFPEIGGGMGLNLGKDRLKSMCESFGARVTSAISGKTDLLIVGKEPGASKVGKASASAKCQLVSLNDLTLSIQGEQQLELADAPEINSFSSGYNGNGLGRIANGGPTPRVLRRSQILKKEPAKAAPAKKAPSKKASTKKSPAKKSPAKKSPAKKSPAKKSPAKKAPAKRTSKTKPKPKAIKSTAARKTASGTKKGSTATTKRKKTPKATSVPATAAKR